MSLAPGTKLGSYEILSRLGAGGMGEVYRARDLRLQRNVALKILPEAVARDEDRLARLKERSQNRDKEITVTALQAQLKAMRRWGSKAPADLSKIHQPVLVANGESDRMVPSRNTRDLARRLPNSDLIIYPDSGHGAVFQFHADFVPKALEFLGA